MKFQLNEKEHYLELLVVSGKLREARDYIWVNGFDAISIRNVLRNRSEVFDAWFLIREAKSCPLKAECMAYAFEYFMLESTSEDYASFIQLLDQMKLEIILNEQIFPELMGKFPFNDLNGMFASLASRNYYQIFSELKEFFAFEITPEMATSMLCDATSLPEYNNQEMLEILLESGANPIYVGPLHNATQYSHFGKTRLLVEAGALVNSKSGCLGTPLDNLLNKIETSNSFDPRYINENPWLIQSIDYLLENGAIPARPELVINALAHRVLFRHMDCMKTNYSDAPEIPNEFSERLEMLEMFGLQNEPLLFACLTKLHQLLLAISEGEIDPKKYGIEVEMLSEREFDTLGYLIGRLGKQVERMYETVNTAQGGIFQIPKNYRGEKKHTGIGTLSPHSFGIQ